MFEQSDGWTFMEYARLKSPVFYVLKLVCIVCGMAIEYQA